MKMNRLFLILSCLSLFLLLSCPNKKPGGISDNSGQGAGDNGGGGNGGGSETEYNFLMPIEISKDFAKIVPPKDGVVGADTDLTFPFPSAQEKWKGVFVGKRTVKLSPFRMSKYEVSYKLWKEVYDWGIKHGYRFREKGRKGGAEKGKYVPEEHNEMEPVTRITWCDCIVWCNAYTHKILGEENCVYLSSEENTIKNAFDRDIFDGGIITKRQRAGFRLPTEAEWEFAARYQGNDSTNAVKLGEAYYTRLDSASGAKKPVGFKKLKYEGASQNNQTLWNTLRDETARVAVHRRYFDGTEFGGNDFTSIGGPTEEGYQKFSPDITGTAVVGSRAANTLGIYDMSGNVSEWVYDEYSDQTPSKEVVDHDPEAMTSGELELDGFAKIIKGGSWEDWSFYNMVGHRTAGLFATHNTDDLGFRVVYRDKNKK